MLFEFKDELKTGVEEMDSQHKLLIDTLNKVYELLKEGKRDEAMRVFKEKVMLFLDWHLNSEEELMEKINFPEFDKHKKAHKTFRKVVTDLLTHVENGDAKAFREALALALGWIFSHIMKMDKKYGEWIRQKGINVEDLDLSELRKQKL